MRRWIAIAGCLAATGCIIGSPSLFVGTTYVDRRPNDVATDDRAVAAPDADVTPALPSNDPCLGESVAKCRARCDAGETRACVSYGEMLTEGDRAPKDVDRAIALFGAACEAGESPGCEALGGVYDPLGGERPDAAKWLAFDARGCAGGAFLSCMRIELAYEHGDRVDRATYVLALRGECRDGLSTACGRLADLGEPR